MGCAHRVVEESICSDCGACVHEIVLNGACYFCAATDVEPTVKPADELVSAERLVRRDD